MKKFIKSIEPSLCIKVQNAQVDEAVKRYNLSKEGRRKLHNEISKKGYGFEEILDCAEDIANQGGKYVNK